MEHLSQILVFISLFALCLSDAETNNVTSAEPKCGEKEKASTLLDVAKDFMNKAKRLYPNCSDDETNCGGKEKSIAFLNLASNMISEVKISQAPCPEFVCPEHYEKPLDCYDVYHQRGNHESGLYTIWPTSRLVSKDAGITVYCDMETDAGGWTVIQRRGNFSTAKDYFYKDWNSYKTGFGDLNEEFWLGNDNIFAITNQAKYVLRFDLQDHAGRPAYAKYDTFWIDDESSSYTLHINGYNGNAGNAMFYNDNFKFSTKNRTNGSLCPYSYQGAWWYTTTSRDCTLTNLNGLRQPGVVNRKGITWHPWHKTHIGMSMTEMKLKPL